MVRSQKYHLVPPYARMKVFWGSDAIAMAEFAVESDSFFSTDRDITSPEYKPISFAPEALMALTV